jgi:hypothetical protein
MLGNLYWCNPSKFYILLDKPSNAYRTLTNVLSFASKLDDNISIRG